MMFPVLKVFRKVTIKKFQSSKLFVTWFNTTSGVESAFEGCLGQARAGTD